MDNDPSNEQEAHTPQPAVEDTNIPIDETPSAVEDATLASPTFTPQSDNTENSAEEPNTQGSVAEASQSSTPAPEYHASKPHANQEKPVVQLKRRPRRTGQPLHLLLQDCSKQHISGYLCKKTPEEIRAILSDKKVLAADLRTYSNDFVLTSARDRVVVEVDEEGKELLKDVDPERDVIKNRFEDESSVFKSYEDAIHDIRVDLYFEGLKPRKQESAEETPEAAARTAELNQVLQIWDTLHKRVEVEPRRAGRAVQSAYPSRGGRPSGPPGSRPHPYAPSRYPPGPYGAPFAGPPPANAPPLRDPRSHHRDYHDRPPYREEYYPDSRDDYRRPEYDRRDPRDHGMRAPGGPPPPGRSDMRDMRDMRDPREFRDRPPPPARNDPGFPGGGRYDDRRRDRMESPHAAPPPRDSRHHGSAGANVPAHPSLPPKPHGSQFDATASQHSQHTSAGAPYAQQYTGMHNGAHVMDPAASQAGYGAYGQQSYAAGIPGQPDYSAYAYAGYSHDPAAQQPYAYGATGWDMSAAAAATVPSLLLQPFSSAQHGRHKAVPLPTDFMAGPSEAPRLSMPEPHEVLGTIRGIIIRDAHGNIGLSQYHFTQAS